MDTGAIDQEFVPWLAAVGLFLLGLAGPYLLPSVLAPLSLVVVVPAFALASLIGDRGLVVGGVLGSTIVPMAFLLFVRHMRKTGELMPKASVIAFAVLIVFSFIYAATGWDMTVRYVSILRATALVMQAVFPPVLIGIAWFAMRRQLTPRRALLLHWFACAWVAWGAFPWHGELSWKAF